jgi:hypothetical protein
MPLGAGQVVDRFFEGQRLLSGIFAAASIFLAVLGIGIVSSASALFALFLAFWLVAAPVYALANAVALRHLSNPAVQFPGVRLWGTVGWMAVGWLVSLTMLLLRSETARVGAFEAFWVASAVAVLASGYCLTLPRTPPLRFDDAGYRKAGLRDVLTLARSPGMPRFLVTALGVSLTTPFMYQVLPTFLEARGMPRTWIPTAMTLGQCPEIVAIAILPWMLTRFGPKATLAFGIAAWMIRFGSLAMNPPLWVAVAGIPLQGVGFACFTVAGQVYTDSQSQSHVRASAQALYMVVTAGLGSFLGSLLAGDVMRRFGGHYEQVFLVPCVIDFALIVYFCAGFRPKATTRECAGAPEPARPFRNDAVRGTFVRAGNLVTESADG